jgi:glycosyltransferase involved in cell wall biosynthesis
VKTIAIDARIIATGTGRYVERLLHYLEQIDTTNRYFVLVRKKDIGYYKPANQNFLVVEADFADYSFGEQIGFAIFLYGLKPDLVHFCMPQQPLLYMKPAVTTVHDLNLLRITANDDMGRIELVIKKIIFGVLLWAIAHRTSRILTPCKFTRQDLVQFAHITNDKITVTYEGADVATNSPPQPVAQLSNQRFIVYVGRAEPYKNNRGLVAAHQKLLQQFPDLRLVIVGKKDILRQGDMAWVEQQGYKQIDFVGFVSDEELAWLYKNCAAYVFPSFMEGFGLPALEAMASGAPIVSSNATCLPEILQDGAHYFDPRDIDSMARAIAEVLSDSKLRQKLLDNASRVYPQYSWRRMAEQTLEVYRKILND